MPSYQYRQSHRGDKTILRPSYLHNGISYTGKTTSLYWIGALNSLDNAGFNVISQSCQLQLISCPKKNTSTMTSSNGNIFALLALCAGNSPVSGDISTQRPVARSFDVFFDLRLIKRLSKHSRGWWFETLSRPPWRHCNATNGHHGCNFVIFLWWDYSTLTLILYRDAFTWWRHQMETFSA